MRSDITLAKLHQVIQITMGWDNSHLHAFTINGVQYSEPEMIDDDFGDEAISEAKVSLKKVAAVGDTFLYEYDFGDDWAHAIKIEKAITADDQTQTPRCIKGKLACPPEDCGGVWGYYDMLEKLAGPPSKERSEIVEWLGGEIDPEEFDIEEINRILCRFQY